MPAVDDKLPVQRAFVERHIGQLVGIFQIDRAQLHDRAEAHSLATDGMVGLVAVADGGKLSETAFNVWTVASHLFNEEGCPESNRLDFTLGALARRMWGEGGRSADRRQRIVQAITELMRTRVVVVGIDPYKLEPAEGAIWELNLLEAAGMRSEWQEVMRAAQSGDPQARSKVAASSGHSAAGSSEANTWSMVLPKWLADSVRKGHGVILDYEIQRALRGSAKRIWVQLQSHSTWEEHTLPRPYGSDIEQLLEDFDRRPEGTLFEVLPAEHDPVVQLEALTIPLDDETYRAFGVTHANRKRDLEAACLSIVTTDPTYLRAEVSLRPGSKRRYELRLIRAAGPLRQERLRLGATNRRSAARKAAV